MDQQEKKRQKIYDDLHALSDLRFPLEDYPVFYEWLNVPPDLGVLRFIDIGCGQGFFLRAVESAGSSVELHGIDFSAVALGKAKSRVSRSYLWVGSAYNLPFRSECFDYCVNLGSLEHFDQPERALREMHRIIKPNGKVMLIVPNQYYIGHIWRVYAYGQEEDQGQEGVTHFRTIQAWKTLFLRESFDITGVQGYNGEDHIAWYFKRKGDPTPEEKMYRSILNEFIKPMIPLSLSQCFVFFLRRQPR